MIWLPILPIFVLIVVYLVLLGFLIFRKAWLLIAAVSLIFLASLRPVIPGGEITVAGANNLDVLLVVDNTLSMVAEDYRGNNPRLTGVKEVVQEIATELSGARFAMLKFDNFASVVFPWTLDTDMVVESLEQLVPPYSYRAKGSALALPVAEMKKMLERAAKKDGGRARIVFYLSDGEDNKEDEKTNFQSLKSLINAGAVLGFGTEKGGKMLDPTYTEFKIDDYAYVRDKNFEVAYSKIDENNLKQIASEMGIDYIHVENAADLKPKLSEIKAQAFVGVTDDGLKGAFEFYYLILIPAVIILLVELFKLEKRK